MQNQGKIEFIPSSVAALIKEVIDDRIYKEKGYQIAPNLDKPLIIALCRSNAINREKSYDYLVITEKKPQSNFNGLVVAVHESVGGIRPFVSYEHFRDQELRFRRFNIEELVSWNDYR